MGKRAQLEQFAEKVKSALSIFDYEFTVKIWYGTFRINVVFSWDTDQITSSVIERFRSVVGDVGVLYVEDHLELYGYPLIEP